MSDPMAPTVTALGGNMLLVNHAGYGETPPCPGALYKKGQIVKLRNRKWLRDKPAFCAIAAVVPPNFPAEHAIADAAGWPRPLMVTVPARSVRYVGGFDGDPRPVLLREADILHATDEMAEVQYDRNAGVAP